MELIDILKERKMTRAELSNYLGVDDRNARKMIEKLRRDGNLIIADLQSGGYSVAKTKEEASPYILEIYTYLMSLTKTFQIMCEEFEKLEE